jgi:RIO-like serine/threonine protein kinase
MEAAELKRLHEAGVRVPKLIACENNVIKMAYIHGETLPDFLCRMENYPNDSELIKAADSIIKWLDIFYHAVDSSNTGENRGDVNGRNFFWDDGQFWGVDFEERSTGAKEQDIGRLVAFILSYNPPDVVVVAPTYLPSL